MNKEAERKEKKRLANKAYYNKIKAKLTALDEIKNTEETEETEETETKDNDFFFQKTQKDQQPPEAKPQQPIIIQAPQPVKASLKSKVMETLILSVKPVVPMLIKQFMITLQTRQQRSQTNTQEEPETHLNMQYSTANSLDF